MTSIAAVLTLAVAFPAFARFPRHLVWRGTITTTDGAVGTFRARTRLHDGRDMDMEYRGSLRCKGDGCPLRHGRIEVFPLDAGLGRMLEVLFGARKPVALNCVYTNNNAPPNYVIEGPFTCHTIVPPEPPPVRLFSEGTLHLVGSRR
jgi:hypothetical protein